MADKGIKNLTPPIGTPLLRRRGAGGEVNRANAIRPYAKAGVGREACRPRSGGYEDDMNMLTNNQPDTFQCHNRRTIRIKGYDYSRAGAYFVTICAYKKQLSFSDIHMGKNDLSDIGKLVKRYWIAIPQHFPNVGCDEFVIMPNHFHEIIVINENNIHNDHTKYRNDSVSRRGKATNDIMENAYASRRGAACCAPTRDKPYFNVVPGSLGAIIRSFKSAVTKSAHKYPEYSNAPIWQRNYYEHVIRNESDLSEKRKYIIDNPAKWNEDEYYSADGFNVSNNGFHSGRIALRPYADKEMDSESSSE